LKLIFDMFLLTSRATKM